IAILRNSAISGLPFPACIHRPTEERRETGPEDHTDIGEIGIGDNALTDHLLGHVDQRLDQFAAEPGEIRMRRRLALLRLAVDPAVKALARLASELLRLDEPRETAGSGHLMAKLGGDR